MITRRSLIGSIISLACAPAIVRASSLMECKPMWALKPFEAVCIPDVVLVRPFEFPIGMRRTYGWWWTRGNQTQLVDVKSEQIKPVFDANGWFDREATAAAARKPMTYPPMTQK